HRRDVDDVLRRKLARRRDERGANRDRRGLHRRLLDHVTALPAQRSADSTAHDAERVRRIYDGIDRKRPQLRVRYVNLHSRIYYPTERRRDKHFAQFGLRYAQAFSSSASTFSSVHFRATASSLTISCFALSSILRSPNDSTLLLLRRYRSR